MAAIASSQALQRVSALGERLALFYYFIKFNEN
jgi:hypothetical protein